MIDHTREFLRRVFEVALSAGDPGARLPAFLPALAKDILAQKPSLSQTEAYRKLPKNGHGYALFTEANRGADLC